MGGQDWTLLIHGMVGRPVEMSFDDLLREALIERDITLACVSDQVGGDLAGNARWLGPRSRRSPGSTCRDRSPP
ncbi:molybdopterin-dependent oxidoreductase [Actinomadura sp. NPDC049753]|uniref:molybdopterin-dependent oxidoreductase n=1 Tax=Actinomadura sp. NPDC049753 TaxID=3154739 RepID=UPI00342BA9C2